MYTTVLFVYEKCHDTEQVSSNHQVCMQALNNCQLVLDVGVKNTKSRFHTIYY